MIKRSTGFTLIEVLIALTVIAIALAAVIQTVHTSTRDDAYLTQKTIAHWVANNVVSGVRLGLIAVQPNKPHAGEAQMMQAKWSWTVSTQVTSNYNILHDTVTVRAKQVNQILAQVQAYHYISTKKLQRGF